MAFVLALLFQGTLMSAQEIAGQVLNSDKTPLPNVSLKAFKNKNLISDVTVDINGNYLIKPLDSGYYDILATYPGYDTFIITKVLVTNGRTTVNVYMQKAGFKKKRQSINVCHWPVQTRKIEGYELFFLIDEINHLPK